MVELTVLVEFVALQRRLVASLLSLYPEFTRNKLLLGTPFKVELCMDAQMWDVSRHGVGVMFRRRDPKPNLVVDVHVEIQNPNRLDAWRLQQFVESKGAVLEFSEAEAVLRSGVGAGILVVSEDGGYESMGGSMENGSPVSVSGPKKGHDA